MSNSAAAPSSPPTAQELKRMRVAAKTAHSESERTTRALDALKAAMALFFEAYGSDSISQKMYGPKADEHPEGISKIRWLMKTPAVQERFTVYVDFCYTMPEGLDRKSHDWLVGLGWTVEVAQRGCFGLRFELSAR